MTGTYLVIRYLKLLCYSEYFSMVSDDPKRDADRLFGKEGYGLEIIAMSRATRQQKKDLRGHQKERGSPLVARPTQDRLASAVGMGIPLKT